jgi:predicted enzyme related to lactoylglutathione lyase
MNSAHLHSVGLHVADMGATLAFYRMLGLAVPPTAAGPVVAAPITAPANGDLSFTFGTSEALAPMDPQRVTDTTARIQIEIGYDRREDVDQVWRSATDAGYQGVLAPFDAPWGVRFAVLTDPDGNRVACTAPLATSPASPEPR